MIYRIKNRLKKSLAAYIKDLNKFYHLKGLSPILFKSISDFLYQNGKMIRPTLFVISYLGMSKNNARNLYRSAVSLELLHNFALIHDDIIDKADSRHGFPSTHRSLDNYLRSYKNKKFGGRELAIIVGDIIYAMGVRALLAIDEDAGLKEKALIKLSDAAIYTGSGEFIELLYTLEDMEKVTRERIYKIYDLKSAFYSFSTPLSIGATLAGAAETEIRKLSKFGLYVGRAFQIKDDIMDLFGQERVTGKPGLNDMIGLKRTILLWYAYKRAAPEITKSSTSAPPNCHQTRCFPGWG
jgi:geranylgeranyl diphosphate synthase type I